MKIKSMIAMGALAFGVLAGAALAQNLTPEQEIDTRQKVQTAVSLAEIAEAEGDGEALLVAARMLSDVGSVAKRTDADSPEFFSVAEMAATAKTMGASAESADALAANAGTERSICYWEYKCGTFECGWVYICE